MVTAIVTVFVIGYLGIALEHVLKINKAATALFMMVACWTIFMIDPASFIPSAVGSNIGSAVGGVIEHHLGVTATTLFFLMGAMTIVEVVDQNRGFEFVRGTLMTQNKRTLLWRITFLTFFLSAVLDNMTTAIVMTMILRKLVQDRRDFMLYASMVIIAANSGGAFSPIGDVTTIMLWNKSLLTAGGVIKEIFLPSVVSALVPALILSTMLKGNLPKVCVDAQEAICSDDLSCKKQRAVFAVGVGGLVFVPIFKTITHLPPFVGILLILSLLWLMIEVFYRKAGEENHKQKRITNILTRIDMATILFFLGILMAVACLETIGVLSAAGEFLDKTFSGNHYVVTGIIGVLSSIVDNVPLVAGCMGMYPLAETGAMAVDGIFWQLLAYCAGVGGSILIIGSAAGVVVMGLAKISFGWYMKNISWVMLIGYFAGILTYWLQKAMGF